MIPITWVWWSKRLEVCSPILRTWLLETPNITNCFYGHSLISWSNKRKSRIGMMWCVPSLNWEYWTRTTIRAMKRPEERLIWCKLHKLSSFTKVHAHRHLWMKDRRTLKLLGKMRQKAGKDWLEEVEIYLGMLEVRLETANTVAHTTLLNSNQVTKWRDQSLNLIDAPIHMASWVLIRTWWRNLASKPSLLINLQWQRLLQWKVWTDFYTLLNIWCIDSKNKFSNLIIIILL